MVIYCCDRCGYSTNHRSVFKKHLNRKNPCKNYLSNTDIATIKGKYNFNCEEKNETLHNSEKTPSKFTPKSSKFTPNSSFLENPCIIFPSKFTPKSSKFTPKSSKIANFENLEISPEALTTNKKKYFFCEFCNKKFTRKDNLKRHKKKRCKQMAIVLAEENKSTKIDELQSKIDILEEKLMTNTYKNSVGDNNVINSNNTLNQNNIVINNYGNENIDYITDKIVKKMIQQGPYASIPKLLQYTHFDKDHPENHNLAITNVRSKYAHVRHNNMWQIRQLSEILEELIMNKFNFIEECYDDSIKEDLPVYKVGIYEDYKEKFKSDTEIRNTIKEKLYEIIINFTKELGLKCK